MMKETSAAPPNMTREQIKELKQLDAREKTLTRKIEAIDKAAIRFIGAYAAAVERINKHAAAAQEQGKATAVRESKKAMRTLAAMRKPMIRECDAVAKRRDIVTGRLA